MKVIEINSGHATKQYKYPLTLSGYATDQVWAMQDGPETHPIGLRLDSGDAGVVYMSVSQAKEIIKTLLSLI
jgi:hypothetical protein